MILQALKKTTHAASIIAMGFALIISGCHREPRTIHKSVYYWQTKYNLSPPENDSLKALGITRIYTRFFDVVINDEGPSAIPVADIQFATKPDSAFEIIPVVFLRNQALINSDTGGATQLGKRIAERIRAMITANGIRAPSEVQLDCDWTIQTREKFFGLVASCKKLLPATKISCTIRLHQVKYYNTCGVPPCDRGMLMFYNMGSLAGVDRANSIYDSATAKAYLVNFKSYPLPLDVAVPLFDLTLLYRNDKPVNSLSPEILSNPVFKPLENGLMMATKDTFMNLIEIKTGDLVRTDMADLKTCLQASGQINKYLEVNNLSVSIFDVHPATFFKYDTTTIQKIYSAFK